MDASEVINSFNALELYNKTLDVKIKPLKVINNRIYCLANVHKGDYKTYSDIIRGLKGSDENIAKLLGLMKLYANA